MWFAATVLVAFAALASATALPATKLPRFPVEVKEDIQPDIESRATSFSCPVFPGTHPTQTCTDKDILWDNLSVNGKSVTFYYTPNDKIITAASATNRAEVREMLETALKRGLSAYQNWATGLKIYIGVVGIIEGNTGLYGLTNVAITSNKVSHCDILLKYPSSTTDPTLRLRTQKAVVHELYHCVQFWENLAGMPKEGQGDRGRWWVEGSARYIDGVLYPPPTYRDLTELGEFPEEYKYQLSLPEQTYEAALYYHYLTQVGVSTTAINNWVATKVARNTLAQDLGDAAQTPMLANNWHGFAEAFANNAINYTTTIPIKIEKPLPVPATTAVPALTVGGSQPYTYNRPAFTFGLVRFGFPVGTEHRVTFPATTGSKCSYREAGTVAWRGHGDPSVTVKNANTPNFSVDILCSCNGIVACTGRYVIARTV